MAPNPFKKNILLALLAIMACLFFLGGLLYASKLTISGKAAEFPAFLNVSVLTISGTLAVNAGMVLGFTFKSSDPNYLKSSNWNLLGIIKDPQPENIQILACYFYITGLLIAMITYATIGFTEDPAKCVPLISSLSTTFIGVVAGALGIALGIPSSGKTS